MIKRILVGLLFILLLVVVKANVSPVSAEPATNLSENPYCSGTDSWVGFSWDDGPNDRNPQSVWLDTIGASTRSWDVTGQLNYDVGGFVSGGSYQWRINQGWWVIDHWEWYPTSWSSFTAANCVGQGHLEVISAPRIVGASETHTVTLRIWNDSPFSQFIDVNASVDGGVVSPTSGSYTAGSAGQTLSDESNYYWRVKAIDDDILSES